MGFLGIIVFVIYNWLFKSDFVIEYFETAYRRVQDYFEKINKKDFYEWGLEWFIMPDIWWIELRILSIEEKRRIMTTLENEAAGDRIDTDKQLEIDRFFGENRHM